MSSSVGFVDFESVVSWLTGAPFFSSGFASVCLSSASSVLVTSELESYSFAEIAWIIPINE